MLRPITVVLVALAWSAAAPAAAKSCIRHAYESMALRRLEVRADGRTVEPPPELGEFDELLNSGERGRALLFWDHDGDWRLAGKWFRGREASEASAVQRAWIEDRSARMLTTSCGYPVPYTPILPGRYRFSEEHVDGGKTSVGIDATHLVVAPDRQRVTLEFSAAGRAYEAIYEVTCARFEWEPGEADKCGPKEVHVDPPPTPANEPASAEPPKIEPPAPVAADAPPPVGARGCAVAPTGGPVPGSLLLLGLVAALRRARRARSKAP